MNLVQAITVNKPTAPQAASNAKGGDFKEYKDAAMKKAENANDTAESTQNSARKKTKDAQVQERFKNFHHANGRKNNVQNKSGQDAEQNTASDEPQDETNTDLSCDSPYYSLLNGIVGILEGFGLLNEETGNNVSTDDINTIIAQAFENIQNAVITDDAAAKAVIPDSKFSEIVARMPQTDQTNTLQLVQGKIKSLVEEYLCSFANVNKGANEENPADQEKSFPAGQDALNASEDDVNIIKLQFMLKNAQEHLKLLLSNANGDLKLHLNNMNSEGPNDKAQKVTDNLLLMVKEVSKDANSKVVKDTVDKQGTAEDDVSFKNSTIFASGTESKSNQAIGEPQIIHPEKETPAAKTVQDNMERIIQKMTVSIKEGKQQFEVALKPEYLGKLSIKLMMDNDGIKAHIKAADSSVKGMITEQLPALQEALKEKGLTVTHIEVSYERPAFENQQSHHQNWQNNNHQKSTRYAVPDLGSVTYEMMSDVPELLANYSSVEFQA